VWVLALGAIGFACGFFGPIALNPDANQGPLVGIFITGPGGALLGLVLGIASRALPPARRSGAFLAACVVWGAGILIAALPGPQYRGELVDGEVVACEEASAKADAAIAAWEKRIAEVTWAKPAANWRDVDRLLAREPGQVATVAVARARRIDELRKPWNRGRLRARAWRDAPETREYFAPGSSCRAWLGTGRSLWWPTSDTSKTWPPDRLPNFLGLQTLAPAPEAIAALAAR
jgi:hypothetical protein